MWSIAGPQYSARICELRHNSRGCYRPGCPEGVEYGLNIVNDHDPKNPDHTLFHLEPGVWQKRPIVSAKAAVRARNAVLEAVARDDQREYRKQPALFELPEAHRDHG
jgi:hypothetical protein